MVEGDTSCGAVPQLGTIVEHAARAWYHVEIKYTNQCRAEHSKDEDDERSDEQRTSTYGVLLYARGVKRPRVSIHCPEGLFI